MTIVLISAVVILAILLIWSWRRTNTALDLAELWEANYAALDQGRDEEAESYEQIILSHMDTIEGMNVAINSYVHDLHFLLEVIDKTLSFQELDEHMTEKLLKVKRGVLLTESEPEPAGE